MTGAIRSVIFIVLSLVAGCRAHYVEPAGYSQVAIDPNDPRGVWLVIRPSQCSTTEPWRADWVAAHDGAETYPFARELSILQAYCSKMGIRLHDAVTRHDDSVQCAACTCPAHYQLFLLVDEADAGAVVDLGGKPMRSSE